MTIENFKHVVYIKCLLDSPETQNVSEFLTKPTINTKSLVT